jgi:hypothetical protein
LHGEEFDNAPPCDARQVAAWRPERWRVLRTAPAQSVAARGKGIDPPCDLYRPDRSWPSLIAVRHDIFGSQSEFKQKRHLFDNMTKIDRKMMK